MNNPKNVFIKLCACSVMLASIFITSCFIPTEEQKLEEENSRLIQLQENKPVDGNISKDGQVRKFSFQVIKGTRYFIYLNDVNDGDKTKTANVGMIISHSDGTYICNDYGNVGNCYTEPYTFSAAASGLVTITVASYRDYYGWEQGSGTFGIKYTSRAEYDVLEEGSWFDDSIIAEGQTNKYIVQGKDKTRYFIYLADKDAGSALTNKTANIGLKIILSDGTYICDNYGNASNCYTYPYSFVTTSNQTIKIITASYRDYYGWEQGIGTYALRYTTRPEYDELPVGDWVDDSILTDGQINKYTINVIEGKTYQIYLNDIDAGSGITNKTANMGLKIFYSIESNVDLPVICDSYSNASKCYNTPYSFTAKSDGTVVIAAASYRDYYGWEQGTGTYAIKYTVTEPDNM